MARTTTTGTGKLLTKAPATKKSKLRPSQAVDADFAASWNGLEKSERRQIRRLVRIGQPQESVEKAELAVAFAGYQRSRAWFRFFWLWVVPLAVAGVVAGLNLHPLVIGMVLGAIAVAYMSRRNYKRVDKVNAELLGDAEVAAVPAAA